jgi:SAM-dependent methyltransferase
MPSTAALEYRTLDPLATRIEAHRLYSETPDDVEAAVRAAAGLTGAEDVLDVGCGTGSFLRGLAAGGHTGALAGVDTSLAAVSGLASADGITASLADAMHLPFADATFDVVTARHMLYHVEDVDLALREANRVLRPGGVFAATVNHPGAKPHVFRLVAEVVAEVGIDVAPARGARVHSDNLPDLIERVFGGVETVRHDNALVFKRPEQVVSYAVALLVLYGVGPDSAHRARVARAIDDAARQWFGEPGRVWRDPKGYVVCVGHRE